MKSTSLGSSSVRIAAMSALRSTAGPDMTRSDEPISAAMMPASEVLPRPGGPASSTCSHGSPRARAASRKIESCSLISSWPTNSARLRGRSERSNSSSPGPRNASGIRAPVAALTRRPGDGAREREPHALLDRQRLVDGPQRRLGLGHRHAEPDERVAGGGVVVARRRCSRRRGRGQTAPTLSLRSMTTRSAVPAGRCRGCS